MDGSGWECYHDEQKRVAERDATIAELRAELAQLHSDFSTNAIALGKVAVERNELRADRDALRARVKELEQRLGQKLGENLTSVYHDLESGIPFAAEWNWTDDGKKKTCTLSIEPTGSFEFTEFTDSVVSKMLEYKFDRPVPPNHVRDEKGVDHKIECGYFVMEPFNPRHYQPRLGYFYEVLVEAAASAKEPT